MIYKYKLTDTNNKVIYDGVSYEDMISASGQYLVKENGFMHINNYGESVYIKYFELTNTKSNTKRGEK